ncbi:hypothetical protein [Salipiger abyssi]|uniref:hypothetical protein n=1 Tax=Salipiger abyssi TaxID=1250539 RepID=UPI003606EEC5
MIATRAAMRVWWAIAWLPDGNSLTDAHRRLALLTGRAMLISGVAAASPPPEIKKVAAVAAHAAARSAAFTFVADAARSAARSSAFAAHAAAADAVGAADAAFAAHAAHAAAADAVGDAAADAAHAVGAAAAEAHAVGDAAAAAVRSAVHSDADHSLEALRTRLLWGDKRPDFLSDILKQSRPFSALDADFDFWIRWYEAADRGEPLDFDLQYRIATEIPDEIWTGEDAPRRVAEWIREIERSQKSSITPPLVRRESGQWDVGDDVIIPQSALDFACGQVEISLDSAIASSGGNGLQHSSFEAILLRRALGPHRAEPSLVAVSFWNACMSLQRKIGDEYPEDGALIALNNVLYTSVEEICGESDVVRARIARLAALETRRYPTAQERADLRQLPGVLEKNAPLTPRAKAEIEEAVEIVVEAEKPPRAWRAVLVNRVTVLGRWLDQGQKADKAAKWLLDLGRRIAGWFFDEGEPPT